MAFDRKEWRKSDKSRRSDHNGHLKRTYGIDLQRYEEILRRQGGGCAICGRKDTGTEKQLFFHVDHDHDTKEIRGLLCKNCNTGVGCFGDTPEIMKAAERYLLRNEEAGREC